MKSKNSNENLSLKILFPVMYGCTLLLVILRSLQLSRFIDSSTGFFTGGDAVNAVFYIITAAACIFFAVVSFLSSEGKRIELAGLKNKGASVGAMLFGVGLIYDGLTSYFKYKTIPQVISYAEIPEAAQFKDMMSSGSLPAALQAVFAIISAVYIFILAKSFSEGSLSAHKRKLLALAPIGWVTFKFISRFLKQISYIRVSDLFLELMMLGLMMLFFIALSQVVSGVFSNVSRWRIVALGLGSALISLSINIPRLIFTFFANEFVNKEYPFSLSDTMFAVFAVFVALAAYKSVSERIIEE